MNLKSISRCQLDLDRPLDALHIFDRAIKIQPSFPLAYINKAKAHKRLGQQKRYCLSLVLAAGQGNQQVMDYLTKLAQAWCIALTQKYYPNDIILTFTDQRNQPFIPQ